MNNASSLTIKYLLLFIVWLLGIYIILFAMCFYAHVNESNIIVNRADALLAEVALEGKPDLIKVASVQNMARKIKPIFFEPYTVFNSLFGKRESYRLINKLLGNMVESHKTELSGLVLGKVDLDGADLGGADLHGSDIRNANLSGAKLRGANLIGAKLNLVNFQGASFLNTKVYKAEFSEAILKGADLRHAVGLTCAQIKSAVIDESTHLPDYISLEGSSKSAFKCIKLSNGRGMDLNGISLADSFLRNSNFKKSNLSHSNFQNADLDYSNFKKSNLSHSNFQNANLYETSFQSANLSQVNFQGAKMRRSYFHGANLAGADLRGADLRHAVGLTCEQIKSAVIDESAHLPDYISLECENTVIEN